jgi:hypothetical protein
MSESIPVEYFIQKRTSSLLSMESLLRNVCGTFTSIYRTKRVSTLDRHMVLLYRIRTSLTTLTLLIRLLLQMPNLDLRWVRCHNILYTRHDGWGDLLPVVEYLRLWREILLRIYIYGNHRPMLTVFSARLTGLI